jgi:protein TonB
LKLRLLKKLSIFQTLKIHFFYEAYFAFCNADYGISGRQKISTQFTIDKNGDVTDIKIRGPHHALENEAKRVIHKIPKMEPGLQSNVPVGVIYTLPIVYDARD